MVALLHVEFSMGRVARQTRPDPPARAGLTWGGGGGGTQLMRVCRAVSGSGFKTQNFQAR